MRPEKRQKRAVREKPRTPRVRHGFRGPLNSLSLEQQRSTAPESIPYPGGFSRTGSYPDVNRLNTVYPQKTAENLFYLAWKNVARIPVRIIFIPSAMSSIMMTFEATFMPL